MWKGQSGPQHQVLCRVAQCTLLGAMKRVVMGFSQCPCHGQHGYLQCEMCIIHVEQQCHSEKKHFARCQAEEEAEVRAEVVVATTEEEVQRGLHTDPETTMGMTTTRQRKWSSHHIAQERHKTQGATHDTVKKQIIHDIGGKCEHGNNPAESIKNENEHETKEASWAHLKFKEATFADEKIQRKWNW